MRTTLIPVLLCAAGMLLPCVHAQQSAADRQALAELRAKAEKGDAQSQFDLGAAFSLGKFGLATNYMEAASWLRKAAEQNLPPAQCNLGVCYERGDGVAKYEVEAYKCYLLAAEQGNTKAKRNASMLELLLSPEELADGKRRAKDWLEQRKKSSAKSRQEL
jgi:TPR repeat protein